MHSRFAFLLALASLSLAIDRTNPHHRPIENHLRILNADPNDAEPLRIEASGGNKANNNNNKKATKPDKDDKPKTLSQQIADGKYGLIQKELFAQRPKRPGVLSYDGNPEVPEDTVDNLGGLEKNDIWLAENHLLVLRGGKFPPYDDRKNNAESPWPALDDYKAPLHQVKIPKRPKVPPPFPVQLTEDGPLQILGTNTTRTLNETDAASYLRYPVPPAEGSYYDPSTYDPYDPHPADPAAGPAALQVSRNASGEYARGEQPFPPPHLLNGNLPPSLGYLPPGAVVLPPPGNQTDELYDYDDPSIYYPPPYSFFYPKDNSSKVPAGPLVPGIVLPPPPNFFAALEEPTTTTTVEPVTTTRKPQRQRKPTTTTTTPLPTTTPTEGTTRKVVKIYPTSDYYSNELKPTLTTTTNRPATVLPPRPATVPPPRPATVSPPRPATVLPSRPDNRYLPIQAVPREPTVTRLRPVNNPPKSYTAAKPLRQYEPPLPSRTPLVTSTQVPLKYHATSNDIETNSIRQGKSTRPVPTPAQYFYYEEADKVIPSTTTTTTRRPARPIYQQGSTEEYYPRPVPPARQRRPQYVYVTARPYNTHKPRFRFIQQPKTTDTFKIHIAQLQDQIRQHYYPTSTTTSTRRPAPKPVYQFSFQAENYSPQNVFQTEQQPQGFPKYSVEIQQAVEITPTQRPSYDDRRPIFYEQGYRPTAEPPRQYYTTSRPTPEPPRQYYTTSRPTPEPPRQYYTTSRPTPEPPRQYYTTPRPDYQYETVGQRVTPRPVSQYSFEVTQNPIFGGFYTKPDEGDFDDRTKKYFTMFGRKLPATTPIPIDQATPIDEYEHYKQKPISLEGDTLVNYLDPRPTVNPDAEIFPPVNVAQPQRYPNVVKYSSRPQDVAPNPEIIKAIPIEVESEKSEDGSFISYQLPGDNGAHFYFLTPQLAQSRDQGGGFYYSRSQRSRIRRNEKTIDKER